jgi:ferrous iron transport protein A
MEMTVFNKLFSKNVNNKEKRKKANNLSKGSVHSTYIIKAIDTSDEEMKNFLFTLGCYEGQTVTIISKISDNYVINIKDARYSIDKDLAKAIII